MLADIVRSAAKALDAPITEEGDSFFVDAWVFVDAHDPERPPRRQIVQVFPGETGDLLYLSSTVGPYSDEVPLAPLLRQMVGALHCSLYLSAPNAEGEEHLRVASAIETSGLAPERLAALIREVALFADRFEQQVFGQDVR